MPIQGKSKPQFLPTQNVFNMLMATFPNKVNPKCAVYLTAVLDYMTAEMLEVAARKAKERRSVVVTLEDITSALHNDPELKKAFPVTAEGASK